MKFQPNELNKNVNKERCFNYGDIRSYTRFIFDMANHSKNREKTICVRAKRLSLQQNDKTIQGRARNEGSDNPK